MSWDIFKQNIKQLSDYPQNISNINEVAELYSSEYDECMKRGKDTVNFISIDTGNVEGLKLSLLNSLNMGLQSNSNTFSLLNEFGNGIIIYWTNAIMNNIPIPAIPAVGSVSNISVQSNNVINSGTWTPSIPIQPVNSTDIFIDLFIQTATNHLSTVAGIINTISMYPSPTGTVPGPGIINWTGYTI